MRKSISLLCALFLAAQLLHAQAQKAQTKTYGQPQPYGNSKTKHAKKGETNTDTGSNRENKTERTVKPSPGNKKTGKQ